MIKKTVISLALILSAAVSTVSAAYVDVPSDAWYGSAVQTVTDKKWFGGYEDGSFRPEQYVTRTEAVVLLDRMFDRMDTAPEWTKNTSVYRDVSIQYWGYRYIAEASVGHFTS